MERAKRNQSTGCYDGRPRSRWVRGTQTVHRLPALYLAWILIAAAFLVSASADRCLAVGGVLVVTTEDEATGQPIASRLELYRSDGKPQVVRQIVSAGRGIALSESIELALPDGAYQFRLSRGPEYRIINGNFTLERTSQDTKTVKLPRMVEMKREGWLSCDMAVPPQTNDLRLRMMAEDLHFAAVIGDDVGPTMPTAIPKNLAPYKPLWTISGITTSNDKDILFYPPDANPVRLTMLQGETTSQMVQRVAQDEATRIAIANPFAWSLPVWLASGEIDGIHVLGEWLREDKSVEKIIDGRPPQSIGFDGPRGPGRYAESIYWNLLEAGFRIAPLAGTGVTKGQTTKSPIGYNRLYVTGNQVGEDQSSRDPLRAPEDILSAAWRGQSVVTNGPMLRPLLGGFPPGHVFQSSVGDELLLDMELNLSVRDEVEYLEMIHNSRVFHSARLDEFAAAGGKLPTMKVGASGWVMVRVVTHHEDHFRMATSAPWYIEFDAAPRISREAVKFFSTWLVECESRLKQLPTDELNKHVPFVTAARRFWSDRLSNASVD